MTRLPLSDSFPGDVCPRCDRGTLFIRNSRPANPRWQVQYLWCTHCPVTLKSMMRRNELRVRKVV